MPTLNDCKFASLGTQGYTGSLNDRTWAWLSDQTGLTTTINDMWSALLISQGYEGNLNDMQVESWRAASGLDTYDWNDLAKWFWCDGGGVYGPSVSIRSDPLLVFCEFQPPVTDDCTASGDYTANDNGFTNPADTWLWTLEPPVDGSMSILNNTAKTCTVITTDQAVNKTINLKVVATDSVSTDTATRTTTFIQRHVDTNTLPVFIGPDINNVQFEINDPISAFDFAVVFTGTNLVYDTIGTWPTGLTLSAAGVLTGTPTVEETVVGLQVRATNSKGNAVTNTFDVEITNLGYSLTVTEQAAGSCSFEHPETGCTAQGTYIATPTDYVPDTWVWSFSSITQGTPVITAGQGTDTVTVDSTGPTTAIFTLKCVASNADPKSAQDLTQFSQVHTDDTVAIAFDGPNIGNQTFQVDVPYTLDVSGLFSGTIETWALLGTWPTSFVISAAGVITGTAVIGDVGTFANLSVRASNTLPDSADSNTFSGDVVDEVLPAFHALTPDETTYEMKGVAIGTGDLTTTHTADLYAPDYLGYEQIYIADEPVWSGGRVVRNNAPWSQDLTDWQKSGITLDLNSFIAPDGTMTADKSTATTGDASLVVGNGWPHTSDTVGGTYAFSFWARAVTGTYDLPVSFLRNNGGYDPRSNTAPLTETWQRFVYIVTSTGGLTNGMQSSFGGFSTIVAPDEFVIWGAQIEQLFGNLTAPSEYVKTADSPAAGASAVKVFANQNGNTVLNNVVTEAVGTPLAEVPYLQYYPAAENEFTYSNDQTQWATDANVTTARDEVGLSCEPNTATTVTDTSSSFDAVKQDSTAVPRTLVVWMKKTGIANYPGVQVGPDSIIIDTLTGNSTVLSSTDLVGHEVIDDGDWWKVLAETSTASNTANKIYGQVSSNGTTSAASATGSVIVGNAEIHLNKTIAEVRGLGPIFTTTAAVATDVTVYSADLANHDATEAAYYEEVVFSGHVSAVEHFVSLGEFGATIYYKNNQTSFRAYDGANQPNLPVTYVDDLMFKCGTSYKSGDALSINKDGTWAIQTNSNGMPGGTQINILGGANSTGRPRQAMKIRELQRYDITSYQEGKDIIDGLMAEPSYTNLQFTNGDNIQFIDGEYVKIEDK